MRAHRGHRSFYWLGHLTESRNFPSSAGARKPRPADKTHPGEGPPHGAGSWHPSPPPPPTFCPCPWSPCPHRWLFCSHFTPKPCQATMASELTAAWPGVPASCEKPPHAPVPARGPQRHCGLRPAWRKRAVGCQCRGSQSEPHRAPSSWGERSLGLLGTPFSAC